jgi:hypothetical protein
MIGDTGQPDRVGGQERHNTQEKPRPVHALGAGTRRGEQRRHPEQDGSPMFQRCRDDLTWCDPKKSNYNSQNPKYPPHPDEADRGHCTEPIDECGD